MRVHTGKSDLEYGLLVALTVIIVMPAVSFLGQSIQTMYTAHEPISKAQGIFDLLTPKPSSGSAGTGKTTLENAAEKRVTIRDIAIQYNPATDQIRLHHEKTSQAIGSAEGTRLLASSLSNLQEEGAPLLNPEQHRELAALAAAAYSLADEEFRMSQTYPEFETKRQHIPTIGFFTPHSDKTQVTETKRLYASYRHFYRQYQRVIHTMIASDNARLKSIHQSVETHAGAISQIAYLTFVKPQAERQREKQQEALEFMVQGNVHLADRGLSTAQPFSTEPFVASDTQQEQLKQYHDTLGMENQDYQNLQEILELNHMEQLSDPLVLPR